MRLGKHVLVSGLAILFGIMVMLVVGCGDDESTTPTTITGSLNDPEFVALKGQIDDFVDSTVSFFKNGLNTINGISEDGHILPPQYAVVPEEQDTCYTTFTADGWYQINIVYTQKDAQGDPVWQTSLHDSIQYRLNDAVLMSNFNTRDELIYKHHWTFDVEDTMVTYASFAGVVDLTFDDLNTTLSTLTGTRDFSAHTQTVTNDSTVWRDFTFAADVNNITLRWSTYTGWSQCPTTGSVSATIEMVYQKDDDDPVTTTWNVTMTFFNGTMSASVTRGNTVWSYTSDVCVVPQ